MNILPLLLILASAAVLAFILARKFSQLSLLDVETLPDVRERKRKQTVLRERALRFHKKRFSAPVRLPAFAAEFFKQVQLWFRNFVGAVERRAMRARAEAKEAATPAEQFEEKEEVQLLVREADAAAQRKDWETAETHYIAAIKRDASCAGAYRGLGKVYVAQGQFDEAKETFAFVTKLLPNDAPAWIDRAEVARQAGDENAAIGYYRKAVFLNKRRPNVLMKLAMLLRDIGQVEEAVACAQEAVEQEPQNPKYLDFLVDASILLQDKTLAKEALAHLYRVNPENQKISSFEERIEAL